MLILTRESSSAREYIHTCCSKGFATWRKVIVTEGRHRKLQSALGYFIKNQTFSEGDPIKISQLFHNTPV